MALRAEDFGAFYSAVWGREPFLWQQRLAQEVLATGLWPPVIDLPTGAGKTSAIDVAVFALACARATFPRRIVFVIDRRVVVDQVAEHAEKLVLGLRKSADPVVREVRDELLALGGDPLDLLAVKALRGGGVIGNSWARWPDQPCVLASTVDQFGSRLLFRGYGVSEGMWPIHAGLTGNDCLVLLDEVHLAAPFAQTLNAIATRYGTTNLPRRWQVVQMSATPVESDGATRFGLCGADLSDNGADGFTRRMRAPKRASLLPIGKKNESAEVVLGREVPRIVGGLEGEVVGVIVNRVASARETASALRDSGVDVVLLTGRMRPLDRDSAVKKVLHRADPDRTSVGDRLVVVATQCIEVGADISFDALVTEVAPIDSLRQRFGRLDRRGRLAANGVPARAVVVGVASSLQTLKPDPVYGAAMALTWAAMTDRFANAEFDVGPLSEAMTELGQMLELAAPRLNAPLLLRSHLDALVATSPLRPVAPEVDPFLHGLDSDDLDRDVHIVWRSDLGSLTSSGTDDLTTAALELCPPHNGERLDVPIGAARRWLSDGGETPVADTDMAIGEAAEISATTVFRWRGPGDANTRSVRLGEIRPGDVLVVSSARGGISGGTWAPMAEHPVSDLGNQDDRAWRLYPGVAGIAAPPRPDDADDAAVEAAALVANVGNGDWVLRRYKACEPGTATWGEFYIARQRRNRLRAGDLVGSDDTNTFTGAVARLDAHLAGVGDLAAEMGERCGFPNDIVEDLRLAGQLHDLGKADPRFQRWLHGNERRAAAAPELLAKSPMNTSRAQRLAARKWAGYPDGLRHELASLAMIDGSAIATRASDWNLVRHLVSSHHGFCRPLPPLQRDDQPVQLAYTVGDTNACASSSDAGLVDSGLLAERFDALVRKYGWHGLAWLETVFRLADHRRSEREAAGDV